MNTNPKEILIVGLGLIGGSIAYALNGFHDAVIAGVDTDPETVAKALKAGAIQKSYSTAAEGIPHADLVIFCTYPHHVLQIVAENRDRFQRGAVVSDVCGSKERLYRDLTPSLSDTFEYVGIHPMAGKEVSGFDNADGTLFQNTGFLIIPLPSTHPETVEYMKELGAYMGADRFDVADPKKHDDIIAYTSDLMHVAATCLCIHYHPDMSRAYTAGAFRDCTRVSYINPKLWTELFLENGSAMLPHMDNFLDAVTQMRDAIASGDADKLYRLLDTANTNKQTMLKR